MDIGFALITADPFFSKVIEIENEVHEICGFKDKLGREHNLPHTTLFQGAFADETDYQNIAKKIKYYMNEINSSWSLNFDCVQYVPEGWYFYNCIRTENIFLLHNYVIKQCEKDIVLKPERLDRELGKLTDSQKKGIINYGYRYAGEAFKPHITLGRRSEGFSEQTMQILEGKFKDIPAEQQIDRITVYRMGPNGTHAETLFELYLDD